MIKNNMFKKFEQLTQPFSEAIDSIPHHHFWKFAWGCTKGFRPFLAGMTLFTALIAAFEALLFAMMGKPFVYFLLRARMMVSAASSRYCLSTLTSGAK